MRPLAEFAGRARIDGLVADLDDTILDHGLLRREAYDAIVRASEAAFPIVIATGRPSGWGEVLARTWPVVGVVTENGAIAWRRDGATVRRIDAVDPATREARRAEVLRLRDAVLARFPELALADDADLRRSDVTIDVGEAHHVAPDRVAAITAFARSLGARTTVSSVHLHLSVDGDDKATGTLRYLATELGIDPSAARARFAFVGDSGNDAACFAAFALTFGVANVAAWARTMSVPPVFVAPSARGAGFAEVVDALLRARAQG